VLAGLSIVHAVFPPHPAAMLAATQFHADLGRTMLWGMMAGLPAAALAGPALSWFLTLQWRKRKARGEATDEGSILFADAEVAVEAVETASTSDSVSHAGNEARVPQVSPLRPGKAETYARVPPVSPLRPGNEPVLAIPPPAGPFRAASAILLPVVLIFLGSWADSLSAPGTLSNQILHFAGSAEVALLIGVLVALVSLGSHVQTGKINGPEGLRKLTGESFEPIAGVLVILAAAGGLSGILRDSGAAQSTVSLALGAHMPPLLLAWLLAAVVRVAMGSSTVAMAVASAVLAPMVGPMGVRPELLVLATGTGSIILSHVNDPGFWMIQSFFKLDLKETLSTWTALETILSVAGLGMTLLLSAVLG
jgi:GntP family gluconate:H+ symporter